MAAVDRPLLVTGILIAVVGTARLGCGGQASFETIKAQPVVQLLVRKKGRSLEVLGRQMSDPGKGAFIETSGEKYGWRCFELSSLRLRPQTTLSVGRAGRIRLDVPSRFKITSTLVDPWPGGSDPVPVQDVLDRRATHRLPGYAKYLRSLLPGQHLELFSWPWRFPGDSLAESELEYALLVAATTSEDACYLVGLDLSQPEFPRLGADRQRRILAEDEVLRVMPESCH